MPNSLAVAATLARVLGVHPDEVPATLAANAQATRDAITDGLAGMGDETDVSAPPPITDPGGAE